MKNISQSSFFSYIWLSKSMLKNLALTLKMFIKTSNLRYVFGASCFWTDFSRKRIFFIEIVLYKKILKCPSLWYRWLLKIILESQPLWLCKKKNFCSTDYLQKIKSIVRIDWYLWKIVIGNSLKKTMFAIQMDLGKIYFKNSHLWYRWLLQNYSG